MFHFPQFPQSRLFYSPGCTWACPHVGFPIRTSPAQAAAHTSPELFAVYRVLRRHLTPRHSPCALVASPQLPCCRELVSLKSSNAQPHASPLALLSLFALTMHLVKSLSAPCPACAASIRSLLRRRLSFDANSQGYPCLFASTHKPLPPFSW